MIGYHTYKLLTQLFLTSGADDAGRFVFRLGEPVVNNNLACIQWYNHQDDAVIQANKSLAEPCPCTSLQAELDPRFVPDSTRPDCYKMVYSGDAWNLCCYDKYVCLFFCVCAHMCVFCAYIYIYIYIQTCFFNLT